MNLSDLHPEVLSLRKKANLGVAFDCPGGCCASRRALQVSADDAETRAAGILAEYRRSGTVSDRDIPALEDAARARHVAHRDQPYRMWVAFANSLGYQAQIGERDIIPQEGGVVHVSDYAIEQLYTRSGETFADLSIAEEIDRTSSGHARLIIAAGQVTVLP